MNFIFISPHFPQTYWEFCHRLKQNGVTVLGIVDTPYDNLLPQLKEALTECYYVGNLGDYDQVYRAVAYFAWKYGRIDWIESNNEYWLEQDARLRTDFNLHTGVHLSHIADIKQKSRMKAIYQSHGIPTARQCLAAKGLPEALAFAAITGYPLIAKPNVGVGANNTYKIDSEEHLRDFFQQEPNTDDYVIEEFITGNICSYDAVIGRDGESLFESMTVWPPSIMDIVNQQLDLFYYVDKDMPDALRDIGRKTVKAFNVFNRFVHLEYFRLDRDRTNLGHKGDFVALEVNMRPAGGYTPDMINYAHSTDVYKIWADMVAFGESHTAQGEQYYCAFASRRDIHHYAHTHDEVLQRYGQNMVMCERMQGIMVSAMGEQMYTVRLKTKEEVNAFHDFVHEKA